MAKKVEDFTNKRFGMLTVKEKVIINNRTYWRCVCDCGNEKIVYTNSLKQGFNKTCGCRQTFKSNVQKSLDKYCIDGTYLPTLKNNRTLNKNNTSGYRGVSYRKDRGKYRAYIKIKKQDIFLGNFDNIEDAIEARKEAEKKYYGKYLDDNDTDNKQV